jgi:hypothetical protein
VIDVHQSNALNVLRQTEGAEMKGYALSAARILNVVRIICGMQMCLDASAARREGLASSGAKHVRMYPFVPDWLSYMAFWEAVHSPTYPVHRQQEEN